jgi:DNA-binding XRE family transcriptional regulator
MTPLERARTARKITKSEAARLCGIDRAHYGRIEAQQSVPSLKVANDIAKAFGNAVTRDQILFPEDYAQSEQQQKAS